jgi:hypothetical protein
MEIKRLCAGQWLVAARQSRGSATESVMLAAMAASFGALRDGVQSTGITFGPNPPPLVDAGHPAIMDGDRNNASVSIMNC